MVKLISMPNLAIISGFKGIVDFYYHDGVACARRWPRSPGRRRSPAVQAQWPAFSNATRLWKQLSPEVQDAYNQMAAGTHMSGYDWFLKGYISGTLQKPPP